VWNAPRPSIEVHHRNLGEVHFRLVPFDPESVVVRSPRGFTDPDQGDIPAILLERPSRAWSAKLPATPDFKLRLTRLPAPDGLPRGSYYLVSSARGDFAEENNTIAIAAVWVSDLALIVRDGRPAGLEGFVLEAGTGAPVVGAVVRTWRYMGHGKRAGPTARTDRNGVFELAHGDPISDVLVEHRERRLGHSNHYWGRHHPYSRQPDERTLIFTDRSIYRPGQTIHYKGLCIRVDAERDDYTTLDSQSVHLVLRDPNGEQVAEADHSTNRHGSFCGTFVAPTVGLRGATSLEVENGPHGAAFIHVE
jgi:uncharacterized protein YfaS (alpha-2-macroglobulin family)